MAKNWYLYKKDALESVLYMCGINQPHYNLVCAACASNMDHSNFVKCRNEYSQQRNLIKFRCLIAHYEKHKHPPPEEFKEILQVMASLENWSSKWDKIPGAILKIPFTLKLTPTGDLNLKEASKEYRSQLLSVLSKYNSTFRSRKKQDLLTN